MSFFDEYLAKRLEDPEFKREWEKSEEEYLKLRNEILLQRLKRISDDLDPAVKWEDIKRSEGDET